MKEELIYKEIGKKIKIERKNRKITQKELADIVGVNNEGTLGTYESGRNRIPIDILIRITNYFKIPLSNFLTFQYQTNTDLIPYNELFKNTNIINKVDYLKKTHIVNIYKLLDITELGNKGIKYLFEQEAIGEIAVPNELYKDGMIVFKMLGDYMSPVIKDNAYIGVDVNISMKDYKDGDIYLSYLGFALWICKVRFIQQVNVSDKIKLHFYFININGEIVNPNKSGLITDESYDKQDIRNFIIGKVKWVMQEI